MHQGTWQGIRSACEIIWCSSQQHRPGSSAVYLQPQCSMGAEAIACLLDQVPGCASQLARRRFEVGLTSQPLQPPFTLPCLFRMDTRLNLVVQSVAFALCFFSVVNVPFFFSFLLREHRLACTASPACRKVTAWPVAEQCSD